MAITRMTVGWLSAAGMVALVGCTNEGATDAAVRIAQTEDSHPATFGYIHDDLSDALKDPVLVENLAVTSSPEDGHFVVHFDAAGQPVELQLEENRSLFSPNFTVVRNGVRMSPEEAGINYPMQGFVTGDPGSWVRVRVRDGQVHGLLFFDDRLLELRPDPWAPNITLLGDATMTDYLPFGAGGDFACGVTSEFTIDAPDDEGSTRTSSGCEAIQIGLVADHTFVSRLGGESQAEDEMITRLNETDAMYRSDINYGFEIMEVQTYPSSGGPAWNNTSTGTTPLDQFSSWKSQNMASYGLAHLNVARTSSGTVGLAWVGATCSASNGAGVSNYLGTGRSSTIVVAHEIGHNVGSGHDSSGAPYIMAPSVNSSATTFSAQSKSSINSHLGSRSCLVPCDGGGDESDDGPTDTGDDAPTDTGDDAPTDTGDDAPTDTGDDAPTDTGDDAPTDTGDDAPTDTGDDAPTDTGDDDDDDDDTGDDTPTDTGDDDDTGDDTPTDTGDDMGTDDVGDDGTMTDPPPPPPPPATTTMTTTVTTSTTAGGFMPEAEGCACSTQSSGSGSGVAFLWLGMLGLGLRRRRSSQS